MESHRTRYRIGRHARHRQLGITAIGFMCLAAVFGVIGLGVLKVTPLYMQKMRVEAVLSNVEKDLSGSGASAQSIWQELQSRFYVEGVNIDRENVKISQGRNGYDVRVQQESKTVFLADLWFLVIVDEQVEILR